MKEIKRLFLIVSIYCAFWYLINIKKVSPGDFHRVLESLGWVCSSSPSEDGLELVYKKNGDTIKLRTRVVNGEQE